MQRAFFVVAEWDADAHVYFSQSDIQGLHKEAASPQELETLVAELAPELIIENHLSADDLATTPLERIANAAREAQAEVGEQASPTREK